MKLIRLCIGLGCNALLALGTAQAQVTEPAAAAQRPTIEFKTVAEALASIKSNPNMHVTVTEGPDVWTVAGDSDGLTQWSFVPPGHEAYPAVVKRAISRSENGEVYVTMAALCEAEKRACDKLIQDFRATNEYMRQMLQRSGKQRQPR